MPKPKYRYILGDSKRESERLTEQAALWDPVAENLFKKIRIKHGTKILEVGPGLGSLHLKMRKLVRGSIDAVERSKPFAEGLAQKTARDGFGEGTIWNMDLIHAPLPKNHYDVVFARWVFLFLPDPLAHLKLLHRALKKGGILAIEDYYRGTFAMIPEPPHWKEFIQADLRFFKKYGGDASIGLVLPELLKRAGFEVCEITPHVKTGGPNSPVWNWVTRYFMEFFATGKPHQPLTAAKTRKLKRAWETVSAKRPAEATIIAPTVLDIIAMKR